uniref:UTP-monosaccharide-1-phosphate uridylyltransferase n=1 Tax=Lactuca sativa TaxID=4236 RepID=A0A9R1VSE8_LACSA|nr:hypothetical protein LSAT_V11C400216230 [Lactuca sativa]
MNILSLFLYAQQKVKINILKTGKLSSSRREVAFVILTSIYAYAKALQLVESSSYFGMKSTQIKLFKQVACLADNDDKLVVYPNNKYRIQTKPHGHGDIHSLLYSSGLLEEWYNIYLIILY